MRSSRKVNPVSAKPGTRITGLKNPMTMGTGARAERSSRTSRRMPRSAIKSSSTRSQYADTGSTPRRLRRLTPVHCMKSLPCSRSAPMHQAMVIQGRAGWRSSHRGRPVSSSGSRVTGKAPAPGDSAARSTPKVIRGRISMIPHAQAADPVARRGRDPAAQAQESVEQHRAERALPKEVDQREAQGPQARPGLEGFHEAHDDSPSSRSSSSRMALISSGVAFFVERAFKANLPGDPRKALFTRSPSSNRWVSERLRAAR